MRVRVRLGTEPRWGLPAMVGYSAAGHAVAVLLILAAPRVIPRKPPPPLILSGQIVSLPSAAPAAAAPVPPPSKPAPRAVPAPATTSEPVEPPPRKPPREIVPPEPGKPRAQEPPPEKPEAPPKEERPPEREAAGPIPEGVGLAAAAGESSEGIPSITSAAFPYDWYRTTMVNLIRSQWRRPVTPGLTDPLRCSVSFVIARTGTVSDVTMSAGSGFSALDLSAVRAVSEASPLPPLPYQFTAPSIHAELVFELTPD